MFLEILLLGSYILATKAGEWNTTFQCPTTIHTTIPGGTYEPWDPITKESPPTSPNFSKMQTVHSALLACPNITSLDLRVTLMGCSSWPDRWNFPFALEGNETYPPLKHLRVEGYQFDERPGMSVSWQASNDHYGPRWLERLYLWWRSGNMQKHFEYKKLPEEQRNKTNLDLWLDAMVWSKIESLGVLDTKGQRQFMDKAAPYLTSLRRLEVWGGWRGSNNTVEFIKKLEKDSLRNLTWIGGWCVDDLRPILEWHSGSMEDLEIRNPENDNRETQVFGKEELEMLPQQAFSLKHLSLSVHRNGTWPLEIFSILTAVPSLETLDLWLDLTSDCQRQKPQHWTSDYMKWESAYRDRNESLPCRGEEQFRQPYLNESSALVAFMHLRDNNLGGQLRKVTFWAGDWSRAHDGPLYAEGWLEGRRAKVVCSTEDKVEGEAWCSVEAGEEYWKKKLKWYEMDEPEIYEF